MKVLFNVLGVVMLPVGAVWMLQGLGIIRMGFMAGHRRWILAGAVLLALGIIILVLTNRKQKSGA